MVAFQFFITVKSLVVHTLYNAHSLYKLKYNLFIVCFGSHDVCELVDAVAPESQYRQNCQAEHLHHLYPLTSVTDRDCVTKGACKIKKMKLKIWTQLRHKKNLKTRQNNFYPTGNSPFSQILDNIYKWSHCSPCFMII